MAKKSINFDEFKEQFAVESELEMDTFVPQKDQKYVIVSYMAFLLGIDKVHSGTNRNFDQEIFKRLQLNKNARVIRNLCMLRNAIECKFVKLQVDVKSGGRSLLSMHEYIPQTAVMELMNDGVKLSQKPSMLPNQYLMEINGFIQDRINNCKTIFPDWIKWEYIKDVFIMPEGTTPSGVHDVGEVFRKYKNCYPYQVYINWPMPHEDGNILLNDKRFVAKLYEINSDYFNDFSRVQDVSTKIKGDIYEFLDEGEKVDMIVDCENSDVYNMISMLRGLEWEQLQKISKIILVNDIHTNLGWNELDRCTDIPIEHIMTERVMENKSIVDGTLISTAFKEFYVEKVDSFVLLSSDSDFWTLVDSLRNDAHFLIMVEHLKCGPDYKDKLVEAGVYYCYLDDFSDGEESEQMKTDILLRAIESELINKQFNMMDLLSDTQKQLRINMDDTHKKQFFKKYLKSLLMTIDDAGNVKFEYKRK